MLILTPNGIFVHGYPSLPGPGSQATTSPGRRRAPTDGIAASPDRSCRKTRCHVSKLRGPRADQHPQSIPVCLWPYCSHFYRSPRADRFSSRRAWRAVFSAATSSSRMCMPVPMYISPGVWPLQAECGIISLCC